MPSPSHSELLEGIAEVASEHLGWRGALAPEMRLVEDLGLDSVGLLTLAVEVENRYRLCLEPADEAEVRTIGDLLRILERKLGE